MTVDDRTKALLEKYKNSQLEYNYFKSVLDLMTRVSTPTSEVYGYAWMNVLHWSTIYTAGLIIGDAISPMGSFDDLSEAVAVVFAEINTDPLMWKTGRLVFKASSLLLQAEKDILSRLEADDTITKIETYLKH